jgi:hypothetical protein
MMRSCLLLVALAALLACPAMAQSSGSDKLSNKSSNKSAKRGEEKMLPAKRNNSGNSCAAYGPGFFKVEGTDTCVQIGGSFGIGVGGSIGRR